jgi:elongation factor P
MAIPATQLRPGMVIKHNNDLHAVFSVEHRTPGNLRAFIQAKLRNLRTGAMFEHRFRSADAIEKITVDEVKMEYLYTDGDNYYFMNTDNYEQTYLGKDILGDAVDYLIPNLQIEVEFFDGKAVGVELPQTVDLTVVETEPGLKSATASSRPRRRPGWWYRCRRSSMKARRSEWIRQKGRICHGRELTYE